MTLVTFRRIEAILITLEKAKKKKKNTSLYPSDCSDSWDFTNQGFDGGSGDG